MPVAKFFKQKKSITPISNYYKVVVALLFPTNKET